jgi:hypothetical protein
MTATFTDKGAKKIAITDPVGSDTEPSEAVSVVLSNEGRTAPVSEELALLRELVGYTKTIHDQLLKARL